jgi:hypothetical protein
VDYDQVFQEIQSGINEFVMSLPRGCKVMFVDPANRFRWTNSEGKQEEGYTQYLERLSRLKSIFHSAHELHPEVVLKATRFRNLSNFKSFGPDGIHLDDFSVHYYCHYLIQIIRRNVSTVNFTLPSGH